LDEKDREVIIDVSDDEFSQSDDDERP